MAGSCKLNTVMNQRLLYDSAKLSNSQATVKETLHHGISLFSKHALTSRFLSAVHLFFTPINSRVILYSCVDLPLPFLCEQLFFRLLTNFYQLLRIFSSKRGMEGLLWTVNWEGLGSQ
jgi:hypothetical protein